MKVLHLLKTNEGAGWAFREIKHLQEIGVNNVVVLPSDSTGSALRYRSEQVKVIAAELDVAKRPWTLLSKITHLRRIVDSEEPDIVHSHFAGTTATARIALHGSNVPIVFQIPGPLHLENSLTRALDLLTIRTNDYYIATVDYVRRLLVEAGVPERKVFLSHYGTELSIVNHARSGKLRAELGLSANVPLVGMVAFMYSPKRFLGHKTGLKGHEYFIEAVALLRRDYPNLRGIIIGSQWGTGGRYENYLKRLAERSCGDAVIFTGFRADVPDIYPDLDVAVHPSLSENAGGAVESLLFGVPTVASRIGGLADIVKDGETGFTFRTKSPTDIVRAVKMILEDPEHARQMAECGRQRMMEEFDVAKTARQVEHIYRQIQNCSDSARR